MYRIGQGVSQDYGQAMDWSMKAASAGNARGQCNIGLLYFYGQGVSTDEKQAMDWYLKAANNGSTDAMRLIGDIYISLNAMPRKTFALLLSGIQRQLITETHLRKIGWDFFTKIMIKSKIYKRLLIGTKRLLLIIKKTQNT
jgi:hypothetical protein